MKRHWQRIAWPLALVLAVGFSAPDTEHPARPYPVIDGGLFVVHAITSVPKLFTVYHAQSPVLWRAKARILRKIEAFLCDEPALSGGLFLVRCWTRQCYGLRALAGKDQAWLDCYSHSLFSRLC